MKPPALLAITCTMALLQLATPPLLAATEGEPAEIVRHTFTVASGGKLLLNTDRGSVTVSGSDQPNAEVEVTRRITRGSGEKARSLLARHEVEFNQDNNTIRVDAAVRGGDRWSWTGPQLEVTIKVRLPREFNAEVQTAGGSVTAAQLKGDLSLRTSGGSVHLEDLAGKIKGRTAGGSIKARGLTGASELTTSGGSITVEGVTGDRLKVGTAGGSINLRQIETPIEAQTSGGSINVETAASPLRATTSGGSITAVLTAAPKAETSLKTSAGGITVTLPAGAAFQLDASTSAGSVRSDFPITTTRTSSDHDNRSSLSGPANGGGPLLKLRTSAGSIRIKQR